MIRRHLQTLATLAAPLQVPLVRYAGRLHGSGEPARIFAAALPSTADFVAGALMTVERRQQSGTAASVRALRDACIGDAAREADVVVAELPWLWRSRLPADLDLRIPAWVSQEVRAPEGMPLEVPAAVRKEAMRHTRREGYAVELCAGRERAGEFYRDYYRSYVTRRFGAGALLVDEDRFLDVSRGQQLAMLMAGGAWVAGILFRLTGDTLELGWFGSRTSPVAAGASEVLDAWVIAHAAGHGARRAVLGHSRPSLADGVVRYKARFGATVCATRFPQRSIGIGIRRSTPAIAAALNAARFISFEGSELRLRELTVRPAL